MSFQPLHNLSGRIIVIAISMVLLISGCGRTVEVPVVSREVDPQQKSNKDKTTTSSQHSHNKQRQDQIVDATGVYIVNRGDTLYSIAWRYGYDFKDVAQWNAINAPYTIYPGQKISLIPKQGNDKVARNTSKSLQPGPVVSEEYKKHSTPKETDLQPKPVHQNKPSSATNNKKVQKVAVAKKSTSPKKPLANRQIVWQWPTNGKLVKLKQASTKKGIDITGRFGQSIKSSADGRVVYSGSGLLGYGRLIIVKHNETYLSAYAHNSKLLVSEGDDVTAGQTIAEMGNTSRGQSLLHFEIRKNGKSVNPLNLLPKR